MERLIDKKEMASLLGIHERTLDNWVSMHKIPFIKLGGRSTPVKFRLSQVEEWLRTKEVKPDKIWR
jgi:excisionase family DNA binding protein